MKKYRLKKDFLSASGKRIASGEELEIAQEGKYFHHKAQDFYFNTEVIKSNPDWFEEIKEPEIIGEYLKKQQRWVDEFMIGLWEHGVRLRNQSTSLQVLLPNILEVIKSLKEEWNEKKYSEKDMEDCFEAARLLKFEGPYLVKWPMNFKDYLQSLNK